MHKLEDGERTMTVVSNEAEKQRALAEGWALFPVSEASVREPVHVAKKRGRPKKVAV